jgi:(1->4)-alpha-D-glucan 1-alpha-D-glucosylmutase
MTQQMPKIKRIPGATYRLQFNRDFPLSQATALLEYLSELGITDVYASPLFQAGTDSTHGYDVCYFGKLNAALGDADAFAVFANRAHELNMGLLVDMVPNHMGAVSSNGWWHDVLQNGSNSQYASFFDVNWNPPDPALRGKVLLPVLADEFDRVLERGDLKLERASNRFVVRYHDRTFPVDPCSLADADPAAVVQTMTGTPGDMASFQPLRELLDRQHYRLAHWKTGGSQINYRRFFDVTELVSLRMESSEVFDATHGLVLEWLQAGQISGLRIDHPDGLRDPVQYLERLQERAAGISPAARREAVPVTGREETCASAEACLKQPTALYVVVEKILSGDEALPEDWPVDGTTGYDFLNRVNGLFVAAENAGRMDRIYRDFTGLPSGEASFESLVYECKRRILETSLVGELAGLTRHLQRLASSAEVPEALPEQWQDALKACIAAFPVYRTYLTERTMQPTAAERAAIGTAVQHARERAAKIPAAMFDFLESVLTLKALGRLETDSAASAREFVLRFQQLTGPVMAKGLEDTAFYRFNRLVSLNEVGGDPARFGVPVEGFHNANVATAAHWPHTLLATATHDTKRGEDARMRINVLSEMPDEWAGAVTRWRQLNADRKRQVRGKPAPTANDEYLLYQSLVGALPEEGEAPMDLHEFRSRVAAFLLKAMREAKTETTWTEPDAAYENAGLQFVETILSDDSGNRFVPDLRAFVRSVSFFGKLNSLAQTVLKLTSPGVPDCYQGTEFWDLSFVDPDNRRPVDFESRKRTLRELRSASQAMRAPDDCDAKGTIKLFVLQRALGVRHQLRSVFDHGNYEPLAIFGARKEHVCAFAREHAGRRVVTVVPRLVRTLTAGREQWPLGAGIWRDTVVALPESCVGLQFTHAFTGDLVTARSHPGACVLELGEVFSRFPVAILHATEPAGEKTSGTPAD